MILSNSQRSVTLPDDLVWLEELTWTAKAVREERGVSGRLVRSVSTRIGGKPVTLQAPSADLGTVPRATVKTLQTMAEEDEEMSLVLSATETLAVTFRHEPAAIEASPALGFTRRQDSERWHVTLRLSTVAA